MEVSDLVNPVLGALLGVIGTYLGLYWRVRQELEADYDKDLRSDRMDAYKALWKATQPLAKYSPPAPVTPAVLRLLSIDLRIWYFETGGIFLSRAARAAYFSLQDALTERIAAGDKDQARPLSEKDFEMIRKLGSQLRRVMTGDVGSRRDPLLPNQAV